MTRADDPRQLNALLAKAWNAGDAAAYGELFTEDAVYVTFHGYRLRGREQIRQVHAALFDGPLRGSRMSTDADGAAATEVRRVASDVAVVVSSGTTRLGGRNPDPSRDSVTTAVAVQRNGGWLISAFQVTRIQTDPSGDATAGPR